MSQMKNLPALQSGKLTTASVAVFSGIRAEIFLGGTAAPMTVMQMTVAPNQGAPDHISHDEDKVFQVMDGNLIFSVEGERFDTEPGECVFVGRGKAHSFSALNGAPAVLTLVSSPARHDRFFAAMDALELPHSLDEVQAVCEQFGQTIVGPVVEA